MKTSRFRWMLLTVITLLLFSTTPAIAQDHGSGGGGGGGGCGDVFGDLIHILRDDITGQPILAQRWIELPAELPGYGWGYCVIAVDEDGEELRFTDLSCDVHEDDLEKVVEVNYFGRLNGGRTKPRNNRMHFDEVISNIKAGMMVTQGPAGRLMIGYDCKDLGKEPCEEWATVDSPMESMGLYVRLMKYGHLATDPYEIDIWAHGDPKLPTQFHPALGLEDWPKFDKNTVEYLLPYDGNSPEGCWDDLSAEGFDDVNGNDIWDPAEPFFDKDGNGDRDDHEPFTDLDGDGEWDPAESFEDTNTNGVRDEFTFLCADREYLGEEDFLSGAVFLATAASKTGKVTRDLVQFWNRIVKVTKSNEYTGKAPLDTLPALVRRCVIEDGWEGSSEAEDQVEPPYTDHCEIKPAYPGLDNYDLFTDLKERFVDFSKAYYQRDIQKVEVIRSIDGETWELAGNADLPRFVELVNGDLKKTNDIDGFVNAARDFLRMIEFLHNYDPPVDLYCTYDTEDCAVY